MGFINSFQTTILEQLNTQNNLYKTEIILTLLIVAGFSIYIYFVYKTVTRRCFYSANFAKTLVGMAVVTTGIVLAMQVNILVSLGMVGALSIVRFRNVVKDPLDLLFLFWSISIGIICGTGVHLIGLIMSVVMTILLFTLDFIPNKSNSYILVMNCSREVKETLVMDTLKTYCKNPSVRTRTCKKDHLDLLIEIKTKKDSEIIDAMMNVEHVQSATLVAHDGEVRY
ncbi:MAG: DUF4956 domain-containing protein [Eubacteriales bacterium]